LREHVPPVGSGGTCTYRGMFKDDKKDGEGRIDYSNGDYYIGNFDDDKKHGAGTFSTTLWGARGEYKANWVNGRIHGAGTFRNYERVDGRWFGTFSFPDFENGVPTSFTSISYCSGSEYVGEIENWKRHGAGKLTSTYNNGVTDEKEGTFANNNLHGKGSWKRTQPDGVVSNTFVGDYENGQKNGNGIETFQRGDRFEGQFSNGRRNGHGVYTFASSGSTLAGLWVNGVQTGPHVTTTTSGDTYTTNYGGSSRL